MREISAENINTKEHWDTIYAQERGSGKQRIDSERLTFVAEQVKVFDKLNGKFLDVGCGNGEFLEKLRKIYYSMHYYGVDIANGAVHLASMDYVTMHFGVGSAEDLPYDNAYFDVTWCGETIEHLKNPTQAINELFRVTKKGGLVMISTPNKHRNPSDEHLWEFDLMDFVKIQEGEIVALDVVCNGISMIGCWVKK